MPATQTMFNKLAAHAKAHHESVNAAYAATYSPGSTLSSRPSMDSHRSSSTSSSEPTNLSKTWQFIKKHAKEHHESLNAAHSIYYSGGMSTTSSSPTSLRSPVSTTANSPRESLEKEGRAVEVEVVEEGAKSEGKVKKVAKALKKKAVEHHRSVNAAYGVYYGGRA